MTSTIDDPTMTPVRAESMRRLFSPSRMALVGASEKNLFSRRAFQQYQRVGAGRELFLVNNRSAQVHGVDTVPTCTAITGGIDCAYLLTPQHATSAALTDAIEAGARAAIVLSQGWAEQGGEGVKRQQELVDQARAADVLLLGPNHLGFVNLWERIAACGLGLDLPVEPGHLALVSQSGAVASSLVGYASRQGVRFSYVITTGNEAMVTVADAVGYLAEDENTKAIAVFAETIRKPAVFREAARRAAELGKAIVILKAGSSELAAQTAAAHTGALVGDDKVIDAVLRQDGVIRVKSVEDLICTGALCAEIGPLRAEGVGVLSVSGGACDLLADRGQDLGITFPSLSARTSARLEEILPAYAHPQNPLDVTGGALANPDVWRKGIEAFADEPEIGLIGVVTSLPTAGEPQRDDTFRAVGETCAATGVPGVIFPQIDQVQSDYVNEVKVASGVQHVMPSVERFVLAAAGLTQWSGWLRARSGRTGVAGVAGAEALGSPARVRLPGQGGPLSEQDARAVMTAAGVPMVPAELVGSRAEAVSAAAALGGSVVLKMCSGEVAHKTELGGVELDLEGPEAVSAAYDRIVARATSAGVRLDGVLVSPMRRGGLELLVGVTRDAEWGQVLAVAFGGALVEVLQDSALRVLPVGADDVREMLTELRGHRLLGGFRGSAPVDEDRLVEVILAVAELAQALGDEIESVEVNPLRVSGDEIEALDALITR
ncbi:acetate--CoA ligase family protein [Kribbia dieselivorans]|uniref:acetate--CoA ligase family protein n=1 Tax=Kribbia dieselivorans TaxID=331526 RepID=UPI000A75C22C|nr:acetate--CoA ligase family protein [Kribbia dieselivorans]